MPRYYRYGGQPMLFASQWKGLQLPGIQRLAAESHGLGHDGLGNAPTIEYLPYRASGPEPLDPGENPSHALHGFDLTDPKTLLMIAAAGAAAWFLFGKKRMRSNPAKKLPKGMRSWTVRYSSGFLAGVDARTKRGAAIKANKDAFSGEKVVDVWEVKRREKWVDK